MTQPPVCDYEGSPYQQVFWEEGNRQYEDACEAFALRKLLPRSGRLLLELGAGAGRNSPRYSGFERVVLLDYSRTQLTQAKEKLLSADRYLFVAANIYSLPFVDGLFDAATMIRVLHHMADPVSALRETRRVLEPRASFILEYANKRNVKAILRHALGKQAWNPFSPEPVEFADMNFNFHPGTIIRWMLDNHFHVRRQITVSHFRVDFLKRIFPARWLAAMDSLLGWTGGWIQVSPSVFLLGVADTKGSANGDTFFRCPDCFSTDLRERRGKELESLDCGGCGRRWAVRNGVYDFKEPLPED